MANQQLRDQVEDYKNRQHKKRRLKRISFGVAICLVAVAIVGLVLPAVTLEYGKTSCGKEEHAHTEQCVTRTLACTLPTEGHVHTASCFDELGALACARQAAGHMHLASCVDPATNALACGQEETVHVHTTGCINPATNTLACNADDALHVHGDTCYTMQNGVYTLVCQLPSAGHVHTAVCLDELGQVVCGQQEAVEMNHQHGEDCYTEDLTCGLEEHVHTDLCYDEITQSIMKNEEKHESDEAADGEPGVEGDTSDAGEADLTAGEIAEAKDQGLLFENEAMIVAFDVPDDIKDKVALTVTEGDAADAGASQPVEGVLEGANVTIADQVTIDDQTPQPDAGDTAADGSGDNVADADDAADVDGAADVDDAAATPATAANASDASTASAKEDAVYASSLYIQATLDGEPVEDIAGLGITARLQVKPTVIAPILSDINYDEVAPEVKDEVGAEVTVVQTPANAEDYPLSDRPKEQSDAFVVNDVQNATCTMAVTGPRMSATVSSAPNPVFKVSYYADLEVVESASSTFNTEDQLIVADTAKATLPTNATKGTTPLRYVKIENGPSGYTVATKLEEKEIYSADEGLEYRKAPNLSYFNKLYENGHYMLVGIYTRQSPDDEWDEAFVNPAGISAGDVHFTNRPETREADPRYTLITDGMEIKLKFATTASEFETSATFYDYDITSGGIYGSGADAQNGTNAVSSDLLATTGNDYYVNTNRQGINSASNYTGSGAAYGFGNVRYGTGINEAKDANGYYINEANAMSVKGDHGVIEKSYFGLVEGIDYAGESSHVTDYDADTVHFASGIDAPVLFGDAQAAGKTKVSSDYSVGFNRVGDTYEITNVSRGSQQVLGNLNSFNKLGTAYGTSSTMATNHFWPLDDTEVVTTYGSDVKFGRARNGNDTALKYQRIEPEAASDNSRWQWYNLNVADNGADHNNYFGMVSQVDFNLEADYIGPLEYFFFGDDDMWVFLMEVDDNDNIKHDTTKLVCDIGGVHQTTGSTVNLRDYLPNGTHGHYALRFYYTERGASGSTCYMRFTLPSVSNSTPEQDTGTIQVEKVVEAAEGSDAFDEEFQFTVDLFGPDGSRLPDDYAYNRYDASGSLIGSDLIIHTGGTFSLKNGEKVVIKYLPVGTTYTIREVFGDDPMSVTNGGYSPSYKYYVNATVEEFDSLGEFEGTIVQNDSAILRKVVFKNTKPYELPATGGIGTHWYWIGGGLLIAAALVLWRRRAMVAAGAGMGTSGSTATRFDASARTTSVSPSGKPESAYGTGSYRFRTGDNSIRKGGRR